jgi:hypothetical protein
MTIRTTPKPFIRRTTVLYHGRTHNPDGTHSVTLSVNARRYTYTLTSPQCDTVEYLCKHVSALKALGFAKSRNSASPTKATSTL